MAKHLARIHGTEEDKVNCPFYFKIGACRHSDRCSRLHHKPAFSPTLLIKHLYQHPVRQAELQQAALGGGQAPSLALQQQRSQDPNNQIHFDKAKAQEDFLEFFEDLYMEFSKFGHIESLHIVDNLGDHLIGHVYVKFRDEEEASDALQVMHGRYYNGRPMHVEFSPVTDFREARCRDYDEEACARGGFCNFLHVKPVPLPLIRSLDEDSEEDRLKHEEERREKEREERRQRHKKRKRERKEGERSSSSSKRRSSSSRRRDDDHDDNDDYDDDYDDDKNSNSSHGPPREDGASN